MDTKNTEKKEYELSFLLRDEQHISAIDGLMKRFGFEIASQSEVRRIMLAYPIKKEQSAFFGFMFFMADPSQIAEFSHELQLENDVLRFLIVNEPIKPAKRERERERGEEGAPQRAEAPAAPAERKSEEKKSSDVVTNEDLEKKLEEILK
jgi:ribosomal protein S6